MKHNLLYLFSVETYMKTRRNLQVAFNRSLKKPPFGLSAGKKKKNYLAEEMQFLLPYVNNRKSNLPRNLPSPEPDEELCEDDPDSVVG